MTPQEKLYSGIAALIMSAAAVFVPLAYLMLTISLFMFLDFVSAIAASLKQKRGFQWKLLVNSIPKAIIYFVLIIVAYYCEVRWLPGTSIGGLMCTVLCVREMKSINKHSKDILGEDMLSIVLNMMKKKS